MNKRILILAVLLLALTGSIYAQTFTEWGTSDPTPPMDCGIYQWPEVQSPCPEVQIKQKHDHTPQQKYLDRGWDTAVTCAQRELVLSCMPYVPVQAFNGQYTVDIIPYEPADTSFHYGTQIPNNSDDQFCALQQLPQSSANGAHPFPFYFFGQKKTSFVAGGNGIITFTSAAASQFCSYNVKPPIPWPDGTSGVDPIQYYRDAIYGVYQDTDPGGNMSGYQGIWYGIKDDFPCRKIIASYNELPWFPNGSNTSNRQSYQIICYEGSNIIEVHVKRRRRGNTDCGWCNWGLIGIQNATGSPQVHGSPGTSTWNVHQGAHAAYFPTGCNTMTSAQQIDETSYRFTPQGFTERVYYWIRIFDNGDTVLLTQNIEDTNGYYSPMQEDIDPYEQTYPSCATLTTAVVKPTMTSRYCFVLRFQNADSTWYNLRDTITIGYDADKNTSLHPDGTGQEVRSMTKCEKQTANIKLEFPSLNDTLNTSWYVSRISNGNDIQLPNSLLNISPITIEGENKVMNVSVDNNALPTNGYVANKIDSIYVQVSLDYHNGCDSNSWCIIEFYPNFDTTEEVTKCVGQSYYWDLTGQTYYSDQYVTVDTTSVPGCDSIVHLDLKFLDVRHLVDHISDCKPYTWRDGKTYYESNAATTANDTVHVINEFGCDDIIQLDFTMHPLTAAIHTDIDNFTFDQNTVELTDVSEGGNSSKWILPDGSIQNGTVAYYTAPIETVEADIWLVAGSPYGCTDTAHVVIPFKKETLYMPNAFTPGNTAGNNLFGSISRNTLTEEMFIYNRRGELVYQCEEVDCTWDGKDLNGNPCEQGTYVYFIRYTTKFEPDRTHVLKGTVTLIR